MINSIKLYVNGKQVNLHPNENLTLTTKINDENIYYDGMGTYSKEFTVPCKDNNEIFSNYNRFDVNELNPHISLPAYLEINTIQILGNVEMKGCNYVNNIPESYILSFYGEDSLFADLYPSDRLLTDINWKPDAVYSGMNNWDLFINYDTITTSWDGTKTYLFPIFANKRPFVFYPYDFYDTTGGTTYTNNIATQLSGGTNTPYPLVNQTGGVKSSDINSSFEVKEFFDQIFFWDKGLTLEWGEEISNFIGHRPGPRMFIMPSVEQSEFVPESGMTSVSFDDTFYIGSGYSDLLYTQYTQYNTEGDFNLSTHKYTAPIDATYNVSQKFWHPHIDSNGNYTPFGGAEPQFEMRFRIKKNGSVLYQTFFYSIVASFEYTQSFTLVAGDELTFDYWIFPIAGIRIASTFECNYSTEDKFNSLLRINDILPEMSIIDFIKGFLKTFNLILIYSKANKKVNIMSKNDWYTSGTTYNFSKYKITDKFTARKPEVFKKLDFRYKEGVDFGNTEWKKAYGEQFGERIDYKTYDYGQDLIETESVFNITPSTYFTFNNVSGTTIVGDMDVYQSIDANNDMVVNDFILFFYDGQQKTDGALYGTSTYFPFNLQRHYLYHVTPYDIPSYMPLTRSWTNSGGTYDRSLTYDGINYDYYYNDNTYTTFFKDDTDNLYDIGTRDVQMDFMLPADVLLKLKLNDKIIVDGFKYSIREFTFNLLDGKTTIKMRTKNN